MTESRKSLHQFLQKSTKKISGVSRQMIWVWSQSRKRTDLCSRRSHWRLSTRLALLSLSDWLIQARWIPRNPSNGSNHSTTMCSYTQKNVTIPKARGLLHAYSFQSLRSWTRWSKPVPDTRTMCRWCMLSSIQWRCPCLSTWSIKNLLNKPRMMLTDSWLR